MTSTASLIVPGFNQGRPITLLNFTVAPGMRAIGGGRTGRLADWSGSFEVESRELAESLDDHLGHTFEEGHSAVSQITESANGSRSIYEEVALRYRGGARFTFAASSRSAAT
ncbi:MAG: hypothetical protein JO267_10505 [Alphaproteobacteria bacterium]|nr:hypothetical protein [Alphaproteobacteria bacterium]